MPTALILGCGRVGAAAGRRLLAAGWQAQGVRRQAGSDDPGFRLTIGDLGDAALLARLPRPDAILLTATPGLRRGRDHGLLAGIAAIDRVLPGIRLVYTGSTAVYADAQGGWVAEDGALADGDPAVAGLIAIERAVLARGDALVLRCPALVGPGRNLLRLADGELRVAGDPERICSFLHEADLADLVALAAGGDLGRGIINAAHPQPLPLRALHEAAARARGLVCRVVGDGQAVRSLRIDAGRLRGLLPGRAWRPVDAAS
jgi:nucleoside-diphosphate-sugar epimerase